MNLSYDQYLNHLVAFLARTSWNRYFLIWIFMKTWFRHITYLIGLLETIIKGVFKNLSDIQNWAFYKNGNSFCKKPHLKCSAGFQIRLCLWNFGVIYAFFKNLHSTSIKLALDLINILVHDINLLYYEHWTDKRNDFCVMHISCFHHLFSANWKKPVFSFGRFARGQLLSKT